METDWLVLNPFVGAICAAGIQILLTKRLKDFSSQKRALVARFLLSEIHILKIKFHILKFHVLKILCPEVILETWISIYAHAQLYFCKITPGSINQQSVSGKKSQVKLLNVLPTVSGCCWTLAVSEGVEVI